MYVCMYAYMYVKMCSLSEWFVCVYTQTHTHTHTQMRAFIWLTLNWVDGGDVGVDAKLENAMNGCVSCIMPETKGHTGAASLFYVFMYVCMCVCMYV